MDYFYWKKGFSLCVIFISIITVDANFKPLSSVDVDPNVSVGYVNMNCHQGYYLNVSFIKNVNVNTTDDCMIECIDTVNCASLNAEVDGTFINCSILSTDRHREVEKFVAKTGKEHCSIMSVCESEMPCSNKERFKCIPNYEENTYECTKRHTKAFNLALNRPVAQSSTYLPDRYPPESPVDGLFTTNSQTNHAANGGHSWWLVFLEKPVLIGSVVIYNTKIGRSRQSDKEVVIFENDDRLQNRRICGTLPDMSTIEKITMTCSPPLYGQGVEIGKVGNHVLTLVEVEVYGFY